MVKFYDTFSQINTHLNEEIQAAMNSSFVFLYCFATQ